MEDGKPEDLVEERSMKCDLMEDGKLKDLVEEGSTTCRVPEPCCEAAQGKMGSQRTAGWR